jgi:aldose 1-epimerase
MLTIVTLRKNQLSCEIRPDLGGCLAGVWLGDTPVLKSTRAADLQSVRKSASYPLVPYSNRIARAEFSWSGQHYALLRNFEPEPHAIHGVGWERPWQLTQSNEWRASLSYQHQGDASWPFAFDAEQHITLENNAIDLRLSVTNREAFAVPAGLGWHPYFVKRPGASVQMQTTGRWEMGPDKLPTQLQAYPGLDQECAALDVDHCFEGWSGQLLLRDPMLQMRVSSNLRRLVVFTHPGRDSIAIEPVSHVNNALQRVDQLGESPASLGLAVLAGGATLAADMRIEVEQQA